MQQRAPPAVDELGDNPQAAQNVAGESPRHAPQPVTAAPHTAPPFICPSSVPLPDSQDKTSFSMENPSSINLPEILPICSNTSQDSTSEDISAEESVPVSSSFPASVNEDCSSSSSSPHGPPVSDMQIDSTVQEMHYGSQTDKEKRHSDSEAMQVSPSRKSAGLLDVTGSEEKQSVMLEYKPETAPTIEPGKNEHKVESVHHESQISTAASSLSLQQSSFDTTEPGVTELSDRVENQSSQAGQPDDVEQTGIHQDSASPVLPSSLSDRRNKQTDISQPQTEEISSDAKDAQETNTLESVEMFENSKDLTDSSGQEPQLPSSETLETPKAGELRSECTSGSRVSLSDSATDRDKSKTQGSRRLLEGEQMERGIGKKEPETVIFCAPTESSSKPSAAVPLFDTSVSLQTEEVVATDTSDQVQTAETPLTTELVHSSQEIVLVREDANITGDWSNMQLNQSYLLREDGTVCEAAIFSSELSTAEPKQYAESFQTDIELHSQSVEVYEFCSLVEEVAEETICVSSSAQTPHSPGYEVNLFNALLENSEDYNEKEHDDTVIVSQHPLPPSHGASKIQTSSDSNSHNLSSKNTVEPHLVLDVNQGIEMANSSEVCFVEVANKSSCSLTAGNTDAGPVTPSPEITLAGQKQAEGRSSPLFETVLQEKDAEASSGILSLIPPVVTSEGLGMESSIAMSVHVSHVDLQTSGLTVLSATETDLTPSQSTESVTLSRETKQESSHCSNIPNPKLLLLKRGETPLLKTPSSLLKKVAGQQNVAVSLATAHKSWPGTASKECLPQMGSAADSLCASVAQTSQQDPTQSSFDTTADQSTTLSNNVLLLPDQNASSSSKSDKEALTVSKTSTPESDAVASEAVIPDVTSSNTPNKVYMVPISMEGRIVMSSISPAETVSQSESLYMEEESEDMEQDELMGENEAQEAETGQVSSAEEASDDEPDKTDGEMTTPGLQYKVRRFTMVLFLQF